MLENLIGLTVFLLCLGAYAAATGGAAARKRATLARVERVGRSSSEPVASTILRETQSDLSSLLSGAAERFPFLRSLELLLYRAGRPISLARLLILSAALLLGGALLGALAGITPAPGLLGAAPYLVVRRMKKRRMKAFDNQFPQALALFSRALRAGHSMSAALQMVGSELPDPVGPEFALVAREIAFGLSPATAMANLQDRLEASDLAVFVTAVLVQMETGGNLAEILDNLGDVIRDRILFDGKVKALTAQSRISANILVVVPFTIVGLMAVLNPEYVAPLFDTETGHKLIIAGLVMVTLGWFACRRVASVKV